MVVATSNVMQIFRAAASRSLCGTPATERKRDRECRVSCRGGLSVAKGGKLRSPWRMVFTAAVLAFPISVISLGFEEISVVKQDWEGLGCGAASVMWISDPQGKPC